MKLWLIVYVWGQVAAVSGPVPGNDIVLCIEQAETMAAAFESNAKAGMPVVNGRRVAAEDITIGCSVSEDRPRLGEGL